MNPKFLKINNEVNNLLQKGLRLAIKHDQMGEPEMAKAILAVTSKMVEARIKSSGLQQALTEFWQDKKELCNRIN